jgi:ATP-binding cassette subfamily F protein 3
MLSIQSLGFRIGGRLLFEDATVQIGAKRRIGVVGRNGTGKSTLLRLIAGDLTPDAGTVSIGVRVRTGYVEQFTPSGDRSVLDVVLAADTERTDLLQEAETATDPHRIADIHTRLADIEAHSAPARAATILAGLGFDEATQQGPISSLSGGWQMRVSLASVLFSAPDLLLLDEPTNHLDLEAALWLEGYLAGYPHTFLLVSHDRGLLNRSVDGILHVDNGGLALYPGGYDRFERTRRERQAHQHGERIRQLRERERIQRFVDRFRAQANKARQAQSRIKMLERMEPIAPLQGESAISFNFPEAEELPPPLLTMDSAAVGYSADAPVLQRLNLRLDMDDRIGLLGQNGNGKSTLLRLLSRQLGCLSGSVSLPRKLRVGYFAQDQMEQLDPNQIPDRTEQAVRRHLGQFGFQQEKADQQVESLSGGERARLVLAGICCDAPQLLLLDEPTNHLDLDAREALLLALNEYNGAVILVTHDHDLLARAVERLWLVANGTCVPYEDDLDAYRRSLMEQKRRPNGGNGKNAPTAPRLSKRDARQSRANARAAIAHLRKAARDAEADLEKLTATQTKLAAVMADPSTYDKPTSEIADLAKRKAELDRAVATAEENWLAAQDALEASAGEP